MMQGHDKTCYLLWTFLDRINKKISGDDINMIPLIYF